MNDKPLTAKELAAIGERVARDTEGSDDYGPNPNCQCSDCTCYRDRARLYVAVERMIGVAIMKSGNRYCIPGMPGDLQWFRTKDAAIDALLAVKQ